MKRRIFTSLLLALLSYPVAADKLARVTLHTLFEEASRAAVVDVESARLVEGGCGVKYTALVVEPLKNATKGMHVTVSDSYLRSAGLRVGKTFVLFEGKDAKCGDIVSHAGYAAFAIESPLLVDYKTAVRIPKSYVELPAGLPLQAGHRRDEDSTEVEWVETTAFLEQWKNKK